MKQVDLIQGTQIKCCQKYRNKYICRNENAKGEYHRNKSRKINKNTEICKWVTK